MSYKVQLVGCPNWQSDSQRDLESLGDEERRMSVARVPTSGEYVRLGGVDYAVVRVTHIDPKDPDEGDAYGDSVALLTVRGAE